MSIMVDNLLECLKPCTQSLLCLPPNLADIVPRIVSTKFYCSAAHFLLSGYQNNLKQYITV